MVLVQYKPTRSQLLQLRRIRRTAERGHRLLKLKQDALIVEFFRVLERAKAVRSNLVEKYRVAEARIAIARAIAIRASATRYFSTRFDRTAFARSRTRKNSTIRASCLSFSRRCPRSAVRRIRRSWRSWDRVGLY